VPFYGLQEHFGGNSVEHRERAVEQNLLAAQDEDMRANGIQRCQGHDAADRSCGVQDFVNRFSAIAWLRLISCLNGWRLIEMRRVAKPVEGAGSRLGRSPACPEPVEVPGRRV